MKFTHLDEIVFRSFIMISFWSRRHSSEFQSELFTALVLKFRFHISHRALRILNIATSLLHGPTTQLAAEQTSNYKMSPKTSDFAGHFLIFDSILRFLRCNIRTVKRKHPF